MSTEAVETTPEVETPEVTTETTVPEQEAKVETVEEQEAAPQDDAAFEAGFNQAQGIDVPEPEPEPQPEPKTVAGYTEEQIKELLAKAAEVDKLREQQAKVFGSLGSLKQSIEQLRNQPRPSATAVQVTKEKFAKLGQMFPEMAEMLAEDLNGVLQGGSADPAQYEQMVDQKLQAKLQEQQQVFEAKVLTVMHPDWRQTVQSQEFGQWKQTLPEEARAELDNSWDAEFIGSKLTEFKDWKSKAVQGLQAKQRRLEAAITPKSASAPPTQTDDDAFLAGFKQVRGRT